ALVGDAQRAYVGTISLPSARGRERFTRDAPADVPDLVRIVLDPPGPRKMLGELRVGAAEDAAVGGYDEAGGAGRALIDGEYRRNAHQRTAGMIRPNSYRQPARASRSRKAPTGKPTTQ